MAEMTSPVGCYDGDELLFYIPPTRNWKERIFNRKNAFVVVTVISIIVLICTMGLLVSVMVQSPTIRTSSAVPSTTKMPKCATTAITTTTTKAIKIEATTEATTEAMTMPAPKTESTFQPIPIKPLPANATDYPPISLLTHMGMLPKFTEIPCQLNAIPTFKYCAIVFNNTYIGEDQDEKEDAKTSSARVANEALFGIHYPKPMPKATHPCEM